MFKLLTLELLIIASFLTPSVANAQKGKKKPSASKPATRELSITRERSYKKDSKNIDFESESLYGQRRTPAATALTQSKSDKSFDLVPIRENWNPEMIQSTATVEVGR